MAKNTWTKEQRAEYYRNYRKNPEKKNIVKQIKDKYYYKKTIRNFAKEHEIVIYNFDFNSASVSDLKRYLRNLRNSIES